MQLIKEILIVISLIAMCIIVATHTEVITMFI